RAERTVPTLHERPRLVVAPRRQQELDGVDRVDQGRRFAPLELSEAERGAIGARGSELGRGDVSEERLADQVVDLQAIVLDVDQETMLELAHALVEPVVGG